VLTRPLQPSPEFRFIQETHTYLLGERILPSITQILDEEGYIDKEWWKPEHRLRGSRVHDAVRMLNKGTLDWADLDDAYFGYVQAYEKLITDFKITPTIYEEPMYHPKLWFAGTPDVVTEDAIWELKTGQIHEWVKLQTIAQEMLVRAWETRPRRRRRFGVRLNKNGTYSRPVDLTNWKQDEYVFTTNTASVQNKPLYGAPMLRGLK
jgi:hypothetical protein